MTKHIAKFCLSLFDLFAHIRVCGRILVVQRIHRCNQLINSRLREFLKLALQWFHPLGSKQVISMFIAQSFNNGPGLFIKR